MNRRNFVKTSLGAVTAASFIGSGRAATDKPNLLFLWTDQQRRDTIKAYGNEKIRTPNLDRLASESLVFEYPYVTQPVCTPSRSTVMTGLWPHQTGCVHNNLHLPPAVPCLNEILEDSSYRTGYFGKWHLGDEVFPQHGFQEWETIEDGYNKYFLPGRDKSRMSTYNQFLREKGFTPDDPDGGFGRDMAAGLPIELSKTRFLEDRAKSFLQRHRREPFILYVNFLEPHPPYFGAMSDIYDPREVTLPANIHHRPDADEPMRYQYLIEKIHESPRTGYPLDSEANWRRLVSSYWGLVTQVDRSVGGILARLQELGLDENTIVVYTSDHGEMLGSHGMIQKGVTYEEAMSIPWLMRAPGMKGGKVPGRYGHIDLVPTLLELMGKPAGDRFPGRSLLPQLKEGRSADHDVFVQWNPAPIDDEIEELGSDVQTDKLRRIFASFARTIITQDGWKLTLRNADKNELYRLDADPLETTNLFGHPEHTATVATLTRKIQEWQRQVEDIAPLVS